MKLYKYTLRIIFIASILAGLAAAPLSAQTPAAIEISSDNQLDFIDMGAALGRRQLFCRVSTALSGTVNISRIPLKYSSFERLLKKKKKKRRKAKKKGKSSKVRKLRKSIKKFRQEQAMRDPECLQIVTDLGVKPKPTPTPTPGPGPEQTPTPIPTPSENFTPLRINSGGPSDFLTTSQYQDTQGNTWENDRDFYGVQSYFHAKIPVTGTSDQEIWMTERYGPAFSYRIPLSEAARYTVVLHMGEIFWEESGQREFDAYIEDMLVLDDIDLHALYGYNTPNVYVFEVNVTDGVLDIDFFGSTQYAKVNAVEVLRSFAEYASLF